jgi:hypothetical protein
MRVSQAELPAFVEFREILWNCGSLGLLSGVHWLPFVKSEKYSEQLPRQTRHMGILCP